MLHQRLPRFNQLSLQSCRSNQVQVSIIKSACSPRLAHPSLHRSIISGRGSEATLHQAPLIFPGSTLTAETTYSYSDIASPPHSIHTVRNLRLGRVQVQERLVHPSIHPNTHSGRPRSPLSPPLIHKINNNITHLSSAQVGSISSSFTVPGLVGLDFPTPLAGDTFTFTFTFAIHVFQPSQFIITIPNHSLIVD